MKNLRLMGAALAALFFFFPTIARADVISELEDTGAVLSQDGRNICSGTIIATHGARELVATAAHCLALAKPDSVAFFNGDHGRILGGIRSVTADVAIVLVGSMRHQIAAPISTHPFRRNENLLVFGLPGGETWSVQRAYSMQGAFPVSVDEEPDAEGNEFPWPDALLIDCPSCNHGSSGGGVFDKEQLVGVLVGGSEQYASHVYIEPIQDVLDLIANVEQNAG
jgi:hypothetical protein